MITKEKLIHKWIHTLAVLIWTRMGEGDDPKWNMDVCRDRARADVEQELIAMRGIQKTAAEV